MKMSQPHYQYLKNKVSGLTNLIPQHKENLSKRPEVKDLNKRLLWDVFHATRIYNEFTYQQFNYNDAHIETAMRKIFTELHIN